MEPFPWRFWCVSSALAIALFGFTLTTAVPVWHDESMIVEYGRVELAAVQPSASFNVRSDSHRPLYSIALVGNILAEIAFRITAPSDLGPHLMALLGQIAAFGCLIACLLRRGVNRQASALLGLAFLLDPLCDISWRGARVDGWALAALFACLALILPPPGRERSDRGARLAFLAAGAVAAIGFFCWPSFAVGSPLILLEFGSLKKRDRHQRLLLIGSFAAGGMLASAAILLPFRGEFALALDDARSLAVLTAQVVHADGTRVQIEAFFWSLLQTPVAAIAGLYALFQRPNRLLLAAFLIAFLSIGTSEVYRLRVLYLVPYFFLAIGSMFAPSQGTPAGFRFKTLAHWVLFLLLLGGFAFTVAGTTMSGLADRAHKNPLELMAPARAAVGSGPVGVYEQEPDLYYVGRALGWRQFRCLDACLIASASLPALRELLSGIEVAIFRGQPDAPTRSLIESLGFRYSAVILPAGGHRSSLFGWNFGPPAYGPYTIYRKT